MRVSYRQKMLISSLAAAWQEKQNSKAQHVAAQESKDNTEGQTFSTRLLAKMEKNNRVLPDRYRKYTSKHVSEAFKYF